MVRIKADVEYKELNQNSRLTFAHGRMGVVTGRQLKGTTRTIFITFYKEERCVNYVEHVNPSLKPRIVAILSHIVQVLNRCNATAV